MIFTSTYSIRVYSIPLYLPVQAVSPTPHSLPFFFLSRTEEQAKADTCARDRRVLQQLALNVHVKLSDLLERFALLATPKTAEWKPEEQRKPTLR